MTWKTSPSTHIDAFVLIFPILFELLRVCSNGLVPDAMLDKVGYISLYLYIFCLVKILPMIYLVEIFDLLKSLTLSLVFPISHFIFYLGTEGKEQQTTFQMWKREFQSSGCLFQFEVTANGWQDQNFGYHTTALGPISPKVNTFSKRVFWQVVSFDFPNCRL